MPRDVGRIFKRRVGEDFSAHSIRVGAAVEQREASITTGWTGLVRWAARRRS